MNNLRGIKAWQGDTIPLTATKPDETATSATLLIGAIGEQSVYTKTATYEDGVADLTVSDEENVQATIPAGEYKYMIRVEYSDGSTLSFPNPNNCSINDLPDFEIKERIG